MKYSRLLSFYHKNVEYKVGDFVTLKHDEQHIYQIKKLGYKKRNDFHPALWFSAIVFTDANGFYSGNRAISVPSRPQKGEYIQQEEIKYHKPSDIEERTQIVPYTSRDVHNDSQCYCRYAVHDSNLIEYEPMKVRFCDTFLEQSSSANG